jgi:uncharacterized membrane protein YgcG
MNIIILIVGVVVVVAGVTVIAITVRNIQRKKKLETDAKQRRIDEAVRQRIDDEREGRYNKTARAANHSRRRPSIQAPSRQGFRTDAPSRSRDSSDDLGSFIIPAMLFNEMMNDPAPSRDSDHSPSSSDSGSSSSFDSGSSGSFDSGSSSSDSGGSFGGGDSGSF